MTQEIVLIVGIQGSGKTTIAKDMVDNDSYVRVCRDEIGGDLDGLIPYVQSALKMGRSVVMDNTFMTTAIRKPFIGLGQINKVPVRCIELTTSLEDAQFNVVQRMIQLEGKLLEPHEIKGHKNPNIFAPVVQFGYRKNYEPPNALEGFASIEQRPFVRTFDKTYKNKALILDYDNTIRECVGGNEMYPTEIEHIKIKPRVQETLEKYKKKKWILLGVSNQSGVAKGILTKEKAEELFRHTNKLLEIDIDFAFCPHQSAPPICFCRKPSVGFGVHFIEKYKLNPAESIFVGDMTTDATFSKRCGFKYVDESEFFRPTT